MSNDELLKLLKHIKYLPDEITPSYISTTESIVTTTVYKGVYAENQSIADHIYHAIDTDIKYNDDCRFYFSHLISIQFERCYNTENMLIYLQNMIHEFNHFYLRLYTTTSSIEYQHRFATTKKILFVHIKDIYRNFCEFNDVYGMYLEVI